MPSPRRKLRIIIVENELLLRLLAEDLVVALGHEVVGWAHSAEEAVRAADRSRPDLMLMDIQLDGDRDGIEAAKEIKDRFCTPSLFVTGLSDRHTRERAAALEPLGYLEKPLTIDGLDRSLFPLVARSTDVQTPHAGFAS